VLSSDDESGDSSNEDPADGPLPLGQLMRGDPRLPQYFATSQLLSHLVEAATAAKSSPSPFARRDQSLLARHVVVTPTRILLHGTPFI
jgi:hypothetical protein